MALLFIITSIVLFDGYFLLQSIRKVVLLLPSMVPCLCQFHDDVKNTGRYYEVVPESVIVRLFAFGLVGMLDLVVKRKRN